MKSFSRQVADILTHYAYKTNDIHINTHIQPLTAKVQPRLTYQIGIAHQIYQRYREQQFKFSYKGVTPKSIAQEIIIYIYKSEDYKIEIDSFGYLLITPTQYYYDKLERQIIASGNVKHQQIILPNLDAQPIDNHTSTWLLNQMPDLSLSSLRMHHYLSLIKRKASSFRQAKDEHMIMVNDLTDLDERSVEVMIQNGMLEHSNICIINPNLKIKHPTIQLFHQLSDIKLKEHYVSIAATLRHNQISFRKKYSNLLGQQPQMITFGDIFPHIVIDQKTSPQIMNKVNRIMNVCLKYENRVPVNLHQLEGYQHQFPKAVTMMENRTDQQRLLLLLDLLQQNRFPQLLSLLSKLNHHHQPYKPIAILNQQLQSLLLH